MKRFALIGKDIQGSLSPTIHSYCFNALSLDAVYNIIDIDSDSCIPDIISKLKSGSLDGINVTAPYKKDFIAYLDQLNPRAESIGSINCIHSNNGKLIGKGPIGKFFSDKAINELVKLCKLSEKDTLFFSSDIKREAERISGIARQKLGKELKLIDYNKFE